MVGTGEALSRVRGGPGRGNRDAQQLEGTAAFHEAATLHDPQVRLGLVQVLLEAGEQPVVLEQCIVTTQVGVKLVIGLLEDLPSPGAAIFQLLQKGRRDRDSILASCSLPSPRRPPLPPGLRERCGGF